MRKIIMTNYRSSHFLNYPVSIFGLNINRTSSTFGGVGSFGFGDFVSGFSLSFRVMSIHSIKLYWVCLAV